MAMSTHTSPSIGSAAQRKNMRKGTHSCFECRRRKIRCIFRADEPNICISCCSRGSKCVEQRRELVSSAVERNKSNLKERVAKLEAIIDASGLNEQDIAQNSPAAKPPPGSLHDPVPVVDDAMLLATNSGTDKTTPSSSSHRSVSISMNADSPHETDPVATLFNNAFWRRKSPDKNSEADVDKVGISGYAVNVADPRTFAKRSAVREALLSILPAPELLGEILNVTSSWWNTWRPLGPWLSDSALNEKPKTLQEFILMALGSEDPSIVGLGILSIAVSIQHLESKKHDYILVQIPLPAGELCHQCFDLVDRLIINDSEFASSREGIEVIVMSGKILMNFGLLKKCWVLNHRAGSYGQLLGLHRPQRLSQSESDDERTRRHRSWLSICQADSLLSLLLGLPYYSDGRSITSNIASEPGTTWSFQLKLIGLTAMVIDKDQLGLSLSVQTTQGIQEDLDLLAGQMGHDFWNAPVALSQDRITREEYLETIGSQFWYHLIRLHLHMPLFIQSLDDPGLGAHKELCLEACRDTLRTYHIMRSDSGSAFNMVKVIDYEAFICSALLLLGIMGYGSRQSPFLGSSMDPDKDLVLMTLTTLRQASTNSGNTIASEAVQGLETLTSLASGDCCPSTGENCQNPYARIVVPYSGTITISPGSFFTNKQTAPKNSAVSQAPIFTLSNSDSQSSSAQRQANVPAKAHQLSLEGLAPMNGADVDNLLVPGYPSIDFDWESMFSMNTEQDWAWLMDVNSNGLNGIL